jgi:hypothetical protein
MIFKTKKKWKDDTFLAGYRINLAVISKVKKEAHPMEKLLIPVINKIVKDLKIEQPPISISDLFVTQETYDKIEKELTVFFKRAFKLPKGRRLDMSVGMILLDLGPNVFYGEAPKWAQSGKIYVRQASKEE